MNNNKENQPIIESVVEWFKNCPHLEDYAALTVDSVEDEISAFAIESIPCNPIVNTYTNGTTLRQYEFHLSSVQAFTQEVLDAIDSMGFFERISEWMRQCSMKDQMPILPGNRAASKIEALTHAYLADESKTKARYSIQCRFTYLEGADF